MSGLFSALQSTAQALSAQSVAISVTSKNIANVNNPGYSREHVVFGSKGQVLTPQGEESLGLQALSVQQDTDSLLNQQVISQIGLTSSGPRSRASSSRRRPAWARPSRAARHPRPSSSSTTSDSGLASALDNFMNAFQALAAQPADSGTQDALVEQATTLSQTFQSIDSNLTQVQTDIGSQVTSDISNANALLGQIAGLNTKIGAAEVNNPGSAVDLRDSREADLEQLAAIVPVNVTEQSNGEDTVTTPGAGGSSITLVQLGSVQGSLSYSGGTVTGGLPAAALPYPRDRSRESLPHRRGRSRRSART